MRLVTFKSPTGRPHVGLLRDDNNIIDLVIWRPTIRSMSEFDMVDLISQWQTCEPILQRALSTSDADLQKQNALHPLSSVQLMAPIPRPRKNVFCLGRNYAEHAAESARAFGQTSPLAAPQTPQYPAIFTKAPTSVIGPYDEIPYDPRVSEEIDWEGELAIVIGRPGKNISRRDAMSHIFGYMVLNDVSARDIQKRHGNQFFKGKSLDGTCPTGPWIVTVDEVSDPGNLELWTRVNGVEKQHDTTASMLLDIPGTIEALSLGMTLESGDIIATGTPAGVGFARQPAEFLHPGDVVEIEIAGIGMIRNTVQGSSPK